MLPSGLRDHDQLINVGTRFLAYATSMGCVLLAALDDAALDVSALRGWSRGPSPRTTTSPGGAPGRAGQGPPPGLRAGRSGGAEEGLRSVAAPIRDRAGAAVGAVNLSAHASRMTIDAARRTLVPPLLATAAHIEAGPAGRDHQPPAAVGGRMSRLADPVACPPGLDRAARRREPRITCSCSTCGRWSRPPAAARRDPRRPRPVGAGGRAADHPAGARLRGAFAPPAPRLSRRVSVERLLVACALLTAAAALRGAGGVAALYAGCALAGLAVAVACRRCCRCSSAPATRRRRGC